MTTKGRDEYLANKEAEEERKRQASADAIAITDQEAKDLSDHYRDEQIDLIYEVLCKLGSIGTDVVMELPDYISHEDVAHALDEVKSQKGKTIGMLGNKELGVK